jgi:hypothetical protein
LIQVGSLKMTKQALIISAASLLLGVVLIGISLWKGIPALIVSGFIVIALGFYQAYVVNCTVVGHCDILAWFLVGLFLFGFFVSAPISILNAQRKLNDTPKGLLAIANAASAKGSLAAAAAAASAKGAASTKGPKTSSK